MRILRVAQKVYPDVKGGGPYHVHAMSRDQATMGHDVTVVTVAHDDAPRRETRDGYTVIQYPTTVELLGNEVSMGVANHLRRADEFDVVHAHSHLYFSTNLAALTARILDVPLAITNHGLYSQNAPEWLFNAYLRTLGKWTFDAADVVFCYTDEDHERLREFGVESRVEVVRNGIDKERFTPEGSESDDVVGEPAVLFVGRLVDGKRPLDAVDAFAHIRKRFPDAGLTFCGDGPLRADASERAQERDVGNMVQFLGHVPYEEMPEIYRAADALILPSRAEGLPRTVLEAMASGVPVVVSDLEQIAPLVDGGGETVPVGNVERFADSLEAVCSNIGEYKPREVIGNTSDWDDTVERTTAALLRLVG